MKQRMRKQEAGTAIVLVISILATLLVIVGVAAEYTSSISRNVQRSTTLEKAVAVADGCLENNFAYWRQLCKTPGQNLPTTNSLAGLTLPTQAQFPNIPNFTSTRAVYDPANASTVQQCRVVVVDPQEDPMAPNAIPIAAVGQSQNGDTTWTVILPLPMLLFPPYEATSWRRFSVSSRNNKSRHGTSPSFTMIRSKSTLARLFTLTGEFIPMPTSTPDICPSTSGPRPLLQERGIRPRQRI